MSISSALNNAASGLAASARLADTISNNVANAMTDGLRAADHRDLVAVARRLRLGGAGRDDDARREPVSDRRAARHGRGARRHRHAVRRLRADDGGDGRAGRDNALSTLATRARDDADVGDGLAAVDGEAHRGGEAAQGLGGAINRIADENVRLRTEADGEIARQVEQVNDALRGSTTSTARSPRWCRKGVDVTGLQDERGRLIDGIASIVPVRAVKRENDQVALYSANGGVLLDGRALRAAPSPRRRTSSRRT